MTKKIEGAKHGVICRLHEERFGYFGWPTVARMSDGTLVMASSGLRSEHVCPYGKTVVNTSNDNGETWSEPRVIQNSMIDDRDAGVIETDEGKLLVSWFRSDTRQYRNAKWPPKERRDQWDETMATWTDETVDSLVGSWVILSDDAGETWGEPIRVPVTAPHGPIRLSNGDLLYLGKRFGAVMDELHNEAIGSARSADGGRTWEELGRVPLYPGTGGANYHEPHVVELPDGKLIGMIRVQDKDQCTPLKDLGLENFSIMQTESTDGAKTWSDPRPLNFHGSPPHLIRHSTGTLVLTYGYRKKPFGQRVALSHDDGATWEHDIILRDDGPDSDLGYPSTIELADGSLYTAYYQKHAPGERCSLLWSRWTLPA